MKAIQFRSYGFPEKVLESKEVAKACSKGKRSSNSNSCDRDQ